MEKTFKGIFIEATGAIVIGIAVPTLKKFTSEKFYPFIADEWDYIVEKHNKKHEHKKC